MCTWEGLGVQQQAETIDNIACVFDSNPSLEFPLSDDDTSVVVFHEYTRVVLFTGSNGHLTNPQNAYRKFCCFCILKGPKRSNWKYIKIAALSEVWFGLWVNNCVDHYHNYTAYRTTIYGLNVVQIWSI